MSGGVNQVVRVVRGLVATDEAHVSLAVLVFMTIIGTAAGFLVDPNYSRYFQIVAAAGFAGLVAILVAYPGLRERGRTRLESDAKARSIEQDAGLVRKRLAELKEEMRGARSELSRPIDDHDAALIRGRLLHLETEYSACSARLSALVGGGPHRVRAPEITAEPTAPSVSEQHEIGEESGVNGTSDLRST